MSPISSGSHKKGLLLLLANAQVYLFQHFHFLILMVLGSLPKYKRWDSYYFFFFSVLQTQISNLIASGAYDVSVLSTQITDRGNFALSFVCTYDIVPLLKTERLGQEV